MNRTLSILWAFLTVLIAGVPCQVMAGTEENSPCVKMHFAGGVGTDYELLIMGTEEGEYSLDWGEGTVTSGQLHVSATRVSGKLVSQDLTIYGNLTVLECSGNQLTALDVTQMPSLVYLISRKNYVTQIDLSHNPKLQMVYIQDTPLEALDLSANHQINTVIATNNHLSSLKLTQHPELETLVCNSNFTLKELNLAECPKLKRLDAVQTLVEKFNLSNCRELTYVSAGLGKPLKEFVLPENNKIDTLMVPMAGLNTLDLSQTKRLKVLVTDNNFGLSSLDLSGMTQLRDLSCGGNSLSELNVKDAPELVSLTCNNNQLTKLDVSGMKKLETLVCYSNLLGELKLEGCTVMSYLDCSDNASLRDVGFPLSLRTLNCSACDFSATNISELTKLTDLNCNDNKISTLDVSKLTGLFSINCSNNEIETIDLENHPALLDVVVSGNPITSGLTLKAADNLRYVSVDRTQLEVCALDELYRSLRKKRAEDDYNDLGGLLLFNDVASSAEVSKTDIATDKGWMVSVLGDGTGCVQDGIGTPAGASRRLSVHENADGWEINNIPQSAKTLYLTTTHGQLIAAYPVASASASVKAPHPGLFIISVDGDKGIVCIKH